MDPNPITVLAGDEAGLIDEHVRSARESLFATESEKVFNFHAFVSSEIPLKEALAQVEVLPCLAAKRLAVLRRVEKLPAPEQELLLSRLLRRPAHLVWILTHEAPRGGLPSFLNPISNRLKLVSCRLPYREEELAALLRKRFGSLKKRIGPEPMDAFLRAVPRDWSALVSGIERVSLFMGEREEVTAEDIEAVCGRGTDENVFHLYESLQEGRFADAYRSLNKLKAEGKGELEILGALVWQYERGVRVGNMLSRGLGPGDVERELGTKPRETERLIRRARSFRCERAAKDLAVLLACDSDIKRGRLESGLALERCLLGLCEVKRARDS